jgi:thioredoxin reductase (NADPH)
MTPATSDTGTDGYDVTIVGGGVAGLSAGIFTARHGLETLIIDAGESILRRNAHLENYPGFPAGIDSALLLEMIEEQAADAGCDRQEAAVTNVEQAGDDSGFLIETDAAECYRPEFVIAATKNTTAYLDGIDGIGILDRGKEFVDTDERGRTGVSGLYAAGRLAEKPHQAITSAGHGAEVAVTLLEDIENGFYHDWVAPDGYFTDRGRDLPPGCEEIDDEERRQRAAAARETLEARLADHQPGDQPTHPSLE